MNHDISVKERDRAFLKIQLERLYNSTSSGAQQIFFCPSENNTAREELKNNSRFFQILHLNFNFLHDLGNLFSKSENYTI